MFAKETIQNYLIDHIPLTQALGVVLTQVSNDKVIMQAPFLNNINHKMTVFGGSLHAVATLTCWSLMYTNLIDSLGNIEIVISHSEVDYLLPVTSDFEAICTKPNQAVWDSFKKMINKKGKGRISLTAQIFQSNQLAVDYHGTFVVLKTPS